MFDIASPLLPVELAFQAKAGLDGAAPEAVRAAIVYKLAVAHRLPPAAASDLELAGRWQRCLASHKSPGHDYAGAKACLDEDRRLEIIARYEAVAAAAASTTGRVM